MKKLSRITEGLIGQPMFNLLVKLNELKITLSSKELEEFSVFFKNNAADKKLVTDNMVAAFYKRWKDR